jgi:hypothetical protein
MKAHRFFTSAAIGVIGVAAACASNPPPPTATTGVTSAQKMDTDIAAAKLADAKCRHAAECNEIGGDKTYASRDACIAENRGKAEDNLRASDCPHGIDASRLQACVADVATESCSGFMSGFNRSMTCKTGALCP